MSLTINYCRIFVFLLQQIVFGRGSEQDTFCAKYTKSKTRKIERSVV